MARPGDLILVHMLESQEEGSYFDRKRWPLHITLLPWFEAPDLEMVRAKLTAKLKGIKSFEVTVGERSFHGDYKGRPVMEINNSPQLQHLHETLLSVIQENQWPLQGRYTSKLYSPHVTQKAGRDAAGTLHIAAVYIAEKLPMGYRQLVAKVGLG